ncbi:MAG: OmpA family protein, partial [Rhodospirillales bacterium]|nr:OmpA family protein [Rhodospirillales bacterium]
RAVLSEKANDALFVLGGVLRNVNNMIGVNGHSDPEPTGGVNYTSNWELSLARAIAVANALRRAGYDGDVLTYGYADSRFSTLSELPDSQKYSLARRVDIVILPTGGNL